MLDHIERLSHHTQEDLAVLIESQREVQTDANDLECRPPKIVAETRRDLEFEVSKSRFSPLLYEALGCDQFVVSPLRSRREDIPEILRRAFESIELEEGHPEYRLTPRGAKVLEDRFWNGNVRELLAVAGELVGLGTEDGEFDHLDVIESIRRTPDVFVPETQYLHVERMRLQAELDDHDWNVSATASSLNVTRSWLRRRMSALCLR